MDPFGKPSLLLCGEEGHEYEQSVEPPESDDVASIIVGI